MPWTFTPAQLRKINGGRVNQPLPASVLTSLNAYSAQLESFFDEKRITSMLERSGGQLDARLAALQRLVTALNDVEPAQRFSAANVSSMLARSRQHFIPVVDGIIGLVQPLEDGQTPLAQLLAAGFSKNNISSMLSGAGGQFNTVKDGLIALVTPLVQGGQTPLQVLGAAGLSEANVAGMLSHVGGNFHDVFGEIIALVAAPAENEPSPFDRLLSAGLSANNVGSIVHSGGKNFGHVVQRLVDFVTPQAPGRPSTFAHIQGAGLSADHIAHILFSVGSDFDNVVANLVQFVTPPAADGMSAFARLRAHMQGDDIALALGAAGNQFNVLVAGLQQWIAAGQTAPLPVRGVPKTIGQAAGPDQARIPFVFDTASPPVAMHAAAHRIVVVMENDDRSKDAAHKLCGKHPSDTLCIEWNPAERQWQAVTQPDGQRIDPRLVALDAQAKLVLVGHVREDGTIASQSPETLGAALAQLLKELGVTAPRKISLGGVCYTAPKAHALDAAADSLAGRFASALHLAGINAPVSGIDGEVFVNAQGRKQTIHSGGELTQAARRHKVTLTMDKAGAMVVQGPVSPTPETSQAVRTLSPTTRPLSQDPRLGLSLRPAYGPCRSASDTSPPMQPIGVRELSQRHRADHRARLKIAQQSSLAPVAPVNSESIEPAPTLTTPPTPLWHSLKL